MDGLVVATASGDPPPHVTDSLVKLREALGKVEASVALETQGTLQTDLAAFSEEGASTDAANAERLKKSMAGLAVPADISDAQALLTALTRETFIDQSRLAEIQRELIVAEAHLAALSNSRNALLGSIDHVLSQAGRPEDSASTGRTKAEERRVRLIAAGEAARRDATGTARTIFDALASAGVPDVVLGQVASFADAFSGFLIEATPTGSAASTDGSGLELRPAEALAESKPEPILRENAPDGTNEIAAMAQAIISATGDSLVTPAAEPASSQPAVSETPPSGETSAVETPAKQTPPDAPIPESTLHDVRNRVRDQFVARILSERSPAARKRVLDSILSHLRSVDMGAMFQAFNEAVTDGKLTGFSRLKNSAGDELRIPKRLNDPDDAFKAVGAFGTDLQSTDLGKTGPGPSKKMIDDVVDFDPTGVPVDQRQEGSPTTKKRLAIDYKSGSDSIDLNQLVNYLLHMQAHGGNVETLSESVRKDAFVADGLVIWCQDGVLADRAVELLKKARNRASRMLTNEVWDKISESVSPEDRRIVEEQLATGADRDIHQVLERLQRYVEKFSMEELGQTIDGAKALLDSLPDNVYVAYYGEAGLQWLTADGPLQ